MHLDYKILPFEVKRAEGDGSEGEGFANAFHNLDSAQEIVAPGAFAESLAEFLETGFMGGLNHNWDLPIGKPLKAEEQPRGLYVGWKISDTAHGRDVKTLLKDGVIKKLSIGYQVQNAETLADGAAVAAYWQAAGYTPSAQDIARAAGGAKLLTKIRLYEFSPVTVPANSMADITRVKAENLPAPDATLEDFEDWLRDAARCSRQAAKTALSRLKALLRDAAEERQDDIPDPPDAPTESVAPALEAPIPAPVLRATPAEVMAGYRQFLELQAASLRLRSC